ncbi:hypothetical protein VIGAN_06098000, partial [Vigna angularis var. angularis]
VVEHYTCYIIQILRLLNSNIHVDESCPWCWWQVRERCKKEWKMFQSRLANVEYAYYKAMRVNMFNSTTP